MLKGGKMKHNLTQITMILIITSLIIGCASAATRSQVDYTFKQALYEIVHGPNIDDQPLLSIDETKKLYSYLKHNAENSAYEVNFEQDVKSVYEKAHGKMQIRREKFPQLKTECTPGYVCEGGVSKYRMSDCGFDTSMQVRCEYGCDHDNRCAKAAQKPINCQARYGNEYFCYIQGQSVLPCKSNDYDRKIVPEGCYVNGDPVSSPGECIKCLSDPIEGRLLECTDIGEGYNCADARHFESACQGFKKEFIKAPGGCMENGDIIYEDYSYCMKCTSEPEPNEPINCIELYGPAFRCVPEESALNYCTGKRVVHYAQNGCYMDTVSTEVEVGYCIYCQNNESNDTTCSDSDGGRDYYIKGTVNGIPGEDYSDNTATDYCTSNTLLNEFFLHKGCIIGTELHECQTECKDGACYTITEG